LSDHSRLQRLLTQFEQRQAVAVIEKNKESSYAALLGGAAAWQSLLDERGVDRHHVVGIKSDFHLDAITLFLSLLANGNTVAFLPSTTSSVVEYVEDAQIDYLFSFGDDGGWLLEKMATVPDKHSLLLALQEEARPGFIIFSSGTSGRAKAILHDANDFLRSFDGANKPFRTVAFLLFDHIAGLDTLFYTLSSGGTLIIPADRSTHGICRLIQQTSAQVLPSSPSFFNLLYLSRDYQAFDLSSLEIVTFGSEPMSESGLGRVSRMFPRVRIIQKYGASEFGSPRSKSRADSNLWLKIDSDAFKIRVVEGILWVKSSSTMLGYLNCPQPLVDDGYYCTGDRVEVDGQWLRILGRHSDIINVGGEKVFPGEVESVLREIPAVEDALVFGEANPLLGNSVCAKIKLWQDRDSKALKKEVRKYCLSKLARYKVPAKIEIVDASLTNERFKRSRV
jgi:acyl-CoA synthetase (AMP-forming)/AMP-acid ligase II